MYKVMRIVDEDDLEVYYMPGHNRQDAVDAFGEDIEVKFLIASEGDEEEV